MMEKKPKVKLKVDLPATAQAIRDDATAFRRSQAPVKEDVGVSWPPRELRQDSSGFKAGKCNKNVKNL